uniref:non-specific serine/threonine protein kinase n=1 Tax=Henneguya salminicola TaxID=69463 RepID=A0A6G3MFH3_HENSL
MRNDAEINNILFDQNPENRDAEIVPKVEKLSPCINVSCEEEKPQYTYGPSDFDILKVVGKGGYGKVMLVRKNTGPDKDNLYAMKIIEKRLLLRNEKDALQTRNERNILSIIKHPFIVELIYAFQTDQKLYLVLEFVQGGDLFSFLVRKHILNELQTRFYICELIMALEFLHLNNIIYRDLKPENILIMSSGHIKLTDFGMAKQIIGNKQSRTICGTIEYMAPEVITRSGHDHSADWWSLGIVMYDMLAGRVLTLP